MHTFDTEYHMYMFYILLRIKVTKYV
jgi:hypothetical protein